MATPPKNVLAVSSLYPHLNVITDPRTGGILSIIDQRGQPVTFALHTSNDWARYHADDYTLVGADMKYGMHHGTPVISERVRICASDSGMTPDAFKKCLIMPLYLFT